MTNREAGTAIENTLLQETTFEKAAAEAFSKGTVGRFAKEGIFIRISWVSQDKAAMLRISWSDGAEPIYKTRFFEADSKSKLINQTFLKAMNIAKELLED